MTTPPNVGDLTTGKSSVELRGMADEYLKQAQVLETMASGLPAPLNANLKAEARTLLDYAAAVESAIVTAAQAEQAAIAAAKRATVNRNTAVSRRFREKKLSKREEALANEAQAAAELRTQFPTETVRITALDFEDDDVATDTYEGADTKRKLEGIMALVDSSQFGVITSGMVRKHVRNLDGSEWGGNPVRRQLRKLVKLRVLVSRSYAGPRPTKQGFASKDVDLYARRQEDIDAQIAEWRRGARSAHSQSAARA